MGVFDFKEFVFRSNKVLPTEYDDALSYYEVLNKVAARLNDVSNAANALADSLVAPYDSTVQYKPGDYVWYNNALYKCTTANYGAFNPVDWGGEPVVFTEAVGDDIISLRTYLETAVNNQQSLIERTIAGIASPYDATHNYEPGDYVSYITPTGDIIYKCISNTTGTFDSSKWTAVVAINELFNYVTGLWTAFITNYQRTWGIVQETGDSTVDAMSQDAVTKLFNTSFSSGMSNPISQSDFITTFGTSFNDIPVNKCFATATYDDTITDKPTSSFRGYVWSVSNNKNHNGCVQFALEYQSSGNKFYYRTCDGTEWKPWLRVVTENNIKQETGTGENDIMSQDAVTKLFNSSFSSGMGNPISQSDFITTFGTSFNDIPINKCFATATYDDTITDKPTSSFRGYVWSVSNNKNHNGCVQFALEYQSSGNKFYYRTCDGSVWKPWLRVLNSDNIKQETGTSENDIMSQDAVTKLVTPSFSSGMSNPLLQEDFITTFGTSFNDIPVNKCFATASYDETITDKPTSSFRGYVWSVSNNKNHNGCVQFALEYQSAGNKFYYRTCEASTWHAWIKIGTESPLVPAFTSGKNIILLGDSIVNGVGTSDSDQSGAALCYVNNEMKYRNMTTNSWAYKFANYCSTELGVNVINNGTSQIGIRGIIQNFDYDSTTPSDPKGLGYLIPERDNVQSVTKPDLIICCCGINSRNGNSTTFSNTTLEFITLCHDRGIPLIMLSPIGTRQYQLFSTPVAKMNEIIKRRCENSNMAYYADLYNLFNNYCYLQNSVGGYYNDDLHPNNNGHDMIYHCVRQLLNL